MEKKDVRNTIKENRFKCEEPGCDEKAIYTLDIDIDRWNELSFKKKRATCEKHLPYLGTNFDEELIMFARAMGLI